MIKSCNVLINNEGSTVIKYDDIEVQLPPIHKKADVVKVEKSVNGYYKIVDDDYIETSNEVTAKPKKKVSRKTTLDENVKNTEDENKLDNQ